MNEAEWLLQTHSQSRAGGFRPRTNGHDLAQHRFWSRGMASAIGTDREEGRLPLQ